MKVYREGNQVIVIPDGDPEIISIPIVDSDMTLYGSSVAVHRKGRSPIDRDKYINISNKKGTLIGTKDQVITYLSTFISSTEPEINPSLFIEVSRGNIQNISSINKSGYNQDIDSNTDPEDVWDAGGLYEFPTSENASHVWAALNSVSTNGMTIEVEGLDVNYDFVIQNIVLDGTDSTTAVALTTPLSRVFRMKVLGAVDADQNIICGDLGKTKTYAQITATFNQTLMAIYTVPKGKTAYIIDFYITLVKAAAANATAQYTLRIREPNGVFQVKYYGGVAAEGNTRDIVTHDPPIEVGEKSDILIRAESVTENNSTVAAGFNLILIDD